MGLTRAECASKYGPIIEGFDSKGSSFLYWPQEREHCVVIKIPPPICFAVKNQMSGRRWTRCYINRDMAKPLLAALKNVVDRDCLSELKTFDGCFNIRMVRGETRLLSAHSWGLAIDLNASINPMGHRSCWTKDFVECFTDEGFTWGGNYWRIDAQHFSWVGF